MKTLLVIGYVWPEPKSSAAGSRMLELMHCFLAAQWRVVFASAASLSEHRADLAALGVQEQAILLNDSSFDVFAAALNPQAVLFDRFFTEEQFGWRIAQACPAALRLLDAEDLHCLRHARQGLLKQSQQRVNSVIEKQSVSPVVAKEAELYAAMCSDDMAQREIAAIYRCDLTLIISHYEMRLLTDYFLVPQQLLHYVPFLFVSIVNSANVPGFSQRQHFISIGNFRHEPNWDAVLYLKHAIWPLIRARLPEAELHIYGAYPPPKATQLHNAAQGFLVKGWAADALEVMQQSRICLAPLRFGAGIKGKLLDAMRCGTPSVTTLIGAESMTHDDTWGGAVENSAEAFADAAVHLYSDLESWQAAQQRAINILQMSCTQDFAHELMGRVSRLETHLVQERQANFTGAMLRHHLYKSTQYMSQWIEAKSQLARSLTELNKHQ